MEGRKEAFRMYLEQSGTIAALTKCFIKLYELKDERPQSREDALSFMKANLSDNFPIQADYDKLLKEVEESRKKIEIIRKTEELAKEKIEEERKRKAEEKKKSTKRPAEQKLDPSRADLTSTANKTSDPVPTTSAEVKTLDAAATLLEVHKSSNCASLLVKHLTRETIENNKGNITCNKKTLLECIMPGLENPTLPVGICAADKEAYEIFKSIFDPILQEYYGLDSTIDVKKLTTGWGNVNTDDELLDSQNTDDFYTRITYAGSMEGYDLIPAMNEDNFNKLNEEVKQILEQLQGDLTGKFHVFPINDDCIKKEMEMEQLLFEPVNKRLEAAGTTDFKNGRAIFQTTAKDLTIWINEEEHLKFISTGTKCDLKTPFIRLREAVDKCATLKCKESEPTFCPTNLGPSIHALVMVKLPKLSSTYRDLNRVAVELALKICVKPTMEDGQFEISNKPKLDVSQFEAIKEFGTEVATLLKKEKDLITTIEEAKTRFNELKQNPTSLLVECLEDNIFDQLGNLETKIGKKFLDCIKPGLEDPTLPVGIYASDADAYEKFAEIFTPIIKKHHYVNDDFTYQFNADWSYDESKWVDLNDTNSSLIKSTRITCSRSLKKYAFHPAMDEKDFTDVMDTVKVVLTGLTGNFEGTFYDLETMDVATKKALEGKKQLFGLNDKRLRDIGATKFWPKGRGVFVCEHEKLVIWVNEEDHLKFISTGDGYEIKETFQRLRDIVEEVGKDLEFAKHASCGWITACPTKMGSTINASVIMELKNLANKLLTEVNCIKEIVNTLEICVEQLDTDQFEISNNKTLNVASEWDAVIKMQDGAAKLKEEEGNI